MKKYQQLLIVSLGVVSFVCFLIYKHEYDRLRNVIEVLEVFGNPPSVAPNPQNQNNNQLEHAAALAAAADLTNNNVNYNVVGQGHNDVNARHGNENVQNPGNSGEVIDNPDNEENTGVGEVQKAHFPLKSKKLTHNSVFENVDGLKAKA